MGCSTSGSPVLHHLPKFAQTHVHWVSDAIQPSHPLLSPSPPALNLSQHQGLFQWVCSLHQGPKHRSFNLSISPFDLYSGLSSFKTDWFDFLAVQRTLKSLLLHTVQKLPFFHAQPSLWSFWSFFQQPESITNWYSFTLIYLLLMNSQAKEWHICCVH